MGKKSTTCEVTVYQDRCENDAEITVVLGGQAYGVCPEHRKLLETEIPPTPQAGDQPVVIVREQLERWKSARRKHEALGDLDAARACGTLQQVWFKVVKDLEAAP